jgi:hypothetical protein
MFRVGIAVVGIAAVRVEIRADVAPFFGQGRVVRETLCAILETLDKCLIQIANGRAVIALFQSEQLIERGIVSCLGYIKWLLCTWGNSVRVLSGAVPVQHLDLVQTGYFGPSCPGVSSGPSSQHPCGGVWRGLELEVYYCVKVRNDSAQNYYLQFIEILQSRYQKRFQRLRMQLGRACKTLRRRASICLRSHKLGRHA